MNWLETWAMIQTIGTIISIIIFIGFIIYIFIDNRK